MLKLAFIFLIIGLLMALLGFGGVGGAFIGVAQILFYIAIVLFLIFLVIALVTGKAVKDAVD